MIGARERYDRFLVGMMASQARRWHIQIDSSEGAVLAGWAVDQSSPNEVVVLEVSSTSGDRLTYAADGYRPDLEEVGHGNGKHAFNIDISHWNLEDQVIKVRAVGDDDGKATRLVHYNLPREVSKQPWIETYSSLVLPLIKMISATEKAGNTGD